MITGGRRVAAAVPDFFVDLLLPETDRAVGVQWIVMSVVWATALITTRRQSRDVRTFVLGLAMLNLAWFAARTIH